MVVVVVVTDRADTGGFQLANFAAGNGTAGQRNSLSQQQRGERNDVS